MVRATAFLDQLQRSQNLRKQVTVVQNDDDEDRFRVGGIISEARESDGEECPVERNQVAARPGSGLEDLPSVDASGEEINASEMNGGI